MCISGSLRLVAALACAASLMATPAAAQIQTGEIFGKVTDSTGAVLPGVTVTIESPALIRPQTVITAQSGGYRIPNLPIGTYTVTFTLGGFRTHVRTDVRVEAGFNAEISPRIGVSAVEETVTVSGESPIVDTRQVKTGQTFTSEMLENIPSARDPWVILEQTPGMTMDRQNVGGSASGQQSSFTVHGGNSGNSMWNVDGVTITDMAATGSSPTYYDFDSFEEIQIQTGGNDASLQTGGVNLNMITKSGGNAFRGSARYFGVNGDWQSSNISDVLYQQGAGSGNPVQEIQDYGFEVGGPIVRNRAWFWGGYGKQDIRVGVVGFIKPIADCNRTFTSPEDEAGCLATDRTLLENYNAKLQYQPATAHKLTFLFTRGDKIRNARSAGPTRPPETAYRQSGPTNLYKGSHQWILSDRMTVETFASYTAGGFVLDFQSPELADVQRLYHIDTGIYGRSYARSGPFDRPQWEYKSDMNYFLTNVLGGDHSFKAGIRWRETPSASGFHVGGFVTSRVRNTGVPCSSLAARCEADLHRDSNAETDMNTFSAYVNNSYNVAKMRLNLGLRYDRADDRALPSAIPANPMVPGLLPGLQFEGADSGVVYNDFSPRVGLTYDLRGNGKTVLKASGAIYYGQGIFTAGTLNPVGSVTVRVPWVDANGDLTVQRNEISVGRDDLITWSSIYDPDNPTALTTPNTVDPNLHNDRTREFIVGFDHELMQNFAVGANYIWRKYDRFSYSERVGLSTSDYQAQTGTDTCGNGTCAQETYQYTYYTLPFRLPASSVLTTDPFYRDHNGLELTARKRFNGRWMLNGSVALGSTLQYYPEARQQDPTNIPFLHGYQDNSRNARWIGKLSGMYAFPLGINASFFLNARQGFPYSRNVLSPTRPNGLGSISVLTEPYGDSRYDNMVMLDSRVEKAFSVRKLRLTASLDVFNATNTDTVLDRFNRQDSSRANSVQEVIVGRVLRLGLRMKF